jgi:hypothetical protein
MPLMQKWLPIHQASRHEEMVDHPKDMLNISNVRI